MAEEAEPVPIELELDAAVRDGDAQVAAAITRLLAELSDRGVTWPADILRDVGPLDLEAAMDAVSVLAYRKIRLEQAGKVRIEEGSEQSDRLPPRVIATEIATLLDVPQTTADAILAWLNAAVRHAPFLFPDLEGEADSADRIVLHPLAPRQITTSSLPAAVTQRFALKPREESSRLPRWLEDWLTRPDAIRVSVGAPPGFSGTDLPNRLLQAAGGTLEALVPAVPANADLPRLLLGLCDADPAARPVLASALVDSLVRWRNARGSTAHPSVLAALAESAAALGLVDDPVVPELIQAGCEAAFPAESTGQDETAVRCVAALAYLARPRPPHEGIPLPLGARRAAHACLTLTLRNPFRRHLALLIPGAISATNADPIELFRDLARAIAGDPGSMAPMLTVERRRLLVVRLAIPIAARGVIWLARALPALLREPDPATVHLIDDLISLEGKLFTLSDDGPSAHEDEPRHWLGVGPLLRTVVQAPAGQRVPINPSDAKSERHLRNLLIIPSIAPLTKHVGRGRLLRVGADATI